VRFVFFLILFAALVPGVAQTRARPSIELSSEVFDSKATVRRTIRASGKIFAGTVIRIEHADPAPISGISTTQITFRAEEAIRGVSRGQVVRIREWAGLWQAGEQYRVGEHVLLFLYPPSKLGLTSPVGGRSGRLQVDGLGQVRLKTHAQAIPRTVAIKELAAALRRAAKE
jgi:hypothetical protein